LSIGVIAILIIGAAVGAAYADKKIAAKESDLSRVNALVRQLDKAHSSLQQIAHYDPLTHMLNRRAFTEMFERMLASHAERGLSLAVMFLDLDHFKRINDTLGHHAGDELLKIIARRLQETLREGDLAARFGGDEFCLLATLRDREEARMIAHRMLARMREPVALGKRTLVMTTSIGISVFPDDGGSCEVLLKHADLALYQSKNRGRNTVNFFDRHLEAKAELDFQLEEELRQALKRNQLTVLYQPVMGLPGNRILALEALVRWPHPELGLLTPNRFIAVAEANGFIAELDNWVLRRACADLRELHQAGFQGLRMAVKLSGLNLSSRDLVEQIAAAIADSGLNARHVELEITENALMSNLAVASVLLARIRDLGVSLIIDDFGIGYSSLAYLQRLPLDGLKIDRSFLRDIPGNTGAAEITAAIIAMAHKLKLAVTAEGIETIEQQSFLRDNGCDRYQGYLVSAPLTMAQLRQFLPGQTPTPLYIIASDS
jgi:diguanylate cyclase (GGDEF)-like protein